MRITKIVVFRIAKQENTWFIGIILNKKMAA
jgi:hypothetical protein